MSRERTQTFCQLIEASFGNGRCFLLSKGRTALYAGLRAMDLPPRSKVIVPGYTCMVVPAAVQYAGLEPVYVDIDPRTYNLNPDLLAQAYSSDVSAVIVQHTYGIPCEMGTFKAWADSKGMPVIEDCCHTFGARCGDQLCGTFGRFAFMSGQWNKPFSTGLGGMLLVNDTGLADRVADIIRDEATAPGRLRNLLLLAQILAFERLVTPRTVGWVTDFYRALTKYGLAIGSSSQEELDGTIPEGYFAKMASCQVKKGLREMARIDQNIEHRKRLTARYSKTLPRLGFAALPTAMADDRPLLRYPVRVANKAEVLREAKKARVEIGSWFEVPLHPEGTRMEDLGYLPGMCPEGELASKQVVNLPTHMKVSESTADTTLEFLRKVAEPVS